MKLIDFSNIGLGMELSPSFSKHTQEGITEALASMLKGLTNNAGGVVILSGCVMTKVGNQYDQTAGYVFYNGEILEVDVFAGNDAVLIPVYNPPANTFSAQAWFGDGVKRDTFYTRKMPMTMAAAGSSVADYTEAVRIESFKANKIQGVWNPITLSANFIHHSGPVASYMIDEFNCFHLEGIIQCAVAAKVVNVAIPIVVPGIAITQRRQILAYNFGTSTWTNVLLGIRQEAGTDYIILEIETLAEGNPTVGLQYYLQGVRFWFKNY
jgi:hypothetical protein